MNTLTLFKCLAEETRLKSVLLIEEQGELCVCELTGALALSQPKVSRHLAQLRDCGLLTTRREGQWVYYSIAASLPQWARDVITSAAAGGNTYTAPCCDRLLAMQQRPAAGARCGATE